MGCQLIHIRIAIIIMEESLKKNIYIYIYIYIHTHTHTHTQTHTYKTLCCILETIINKLYFNKIIVRNNRKYMCW